MVYKFSYKYRPKEGPYSLYYKLIFVLVAIALSFAILTAFTMPSNVRITPTTTMPTTTTTLQPHPLTGELIVAVKDAQHKLPGGTTVFNMNIRIGNVSVHYVLGNQSNVSDDVEDKNWRVLSSQEKTIDLLQYTDIRAIIGDGFILEGKYTQIRLHIEDANITIRNTNMGIWGSKTYPMVIPSKELKLTHRFTIESDKVTALILDLDFEHSVTHTDEGYVLKPTIKIIEERLSPGELLPNSEVV